MEKRSGNVILGIIVCLIVLLIVGLSAFIVKSTPSIMPPSIQSAKGDAIGVVTVEGIILDSESTIEKLLTAEEDDNIKGIILRINSPGGAVAPTQEIYEEVMRIREIKPVYASFGTVAASGGYYLGSAANKIFTNKGTLTGSIGVIMQFANVKELMDFIKVEPYVIKAGKYKDIGNQNRDMTEEEKTLLTKVINQTHDQFIGDILRGRGDKIAEESLRELAQGQIFNGEEAVKLHLCDAIGGKQLAARELHKTLGLKNKLELIEVKTKKEQSVWRFLDKLDDVESTIDSFKAMNTTAPMFLYK